MLKTTRLLETKLALAYRNLISCGDRHLARLASSNHVCNACLDAGCICQNSTKVAFEITRMLHFNPKLGLNVIHQSFGVNFKPRAAPALLPPTPWPPQAWPACAANTGPDRLCPSPLALNTLTHELILAGMAGPSRPEAISCLFSPRTAPPHCSSQSCVLRLAAGHPATPGSPSSALHSIASAG